MNTKHICLSELLSSIALNISNLVDTLNIQVVCGVTLSDKWFLTFQRIAVALEMIALHSSKMQDPTFLTECDITEDSDLQQHNHEYLKTASSFLTKILQFASI